MVYKLHLNKIVRNECKKHFSISKRIKKREKAKLGKLKAKTSKSPRIQPIWHGLHTLCFLELDVGLTIKS